MAEHKEQNKKSIRFFNDREVRAKWDDSHNKWGSLCWTSLQQSTSRMITKRPETIGSISKQS